MSPYHEGKFKVVTVKGTFFDCKSQAVEDGDENLNKNNNTLNSMLQCILTLEKRSHGLYLHITVRAFN